MKSILQISERTASGASPEYSVLRAFMPYDGSGGATTVDTAAAASAAVASLSLSVALRRTSCINGRSAATVGGLAA
jgi:hypothetical protein